MIAARGNISASWYTSPAAHADRPGNREKRRFQTWLDSLRWGFFRPFQLRRESGHFCLLNMQQLQLTEAGQAGAVITMTSLELVDFINSQREPGSPELLHKNFLAKVPEVLGETSAEFSADLPDSYGRPRRGYRFPKREACLMAMSYSYELQAKVFDRMTELEAAARAPAPSVAQPAAPSALPEVARSMIALHGAGVVSKREALRRIDAAMIADNPAMAALLARPARRPSAAPAPIQASIPMPELRKAATRPAKAAPAAIRTTGLPPMGFSGGEAFVLEEVAGYVEGGYHALIQAMLDRGLVIDSNGTPSRTTGKAYTTRRSPRGMHWRVRDLLRALGAKV